MSEEFDVVEMIIGEAGILDERHAREAAAAFVLVRRRYPRAVVNITLHGYDDDPREIWEIPEARSYMRRWAQLAGLGDYRKAWAAIGDQRQFPFMYQLLATCRVWPEVQVRAAEKEVEQ